MSQTSSCGVIVIEHDGRQGVFEDQQEAWLMQEVLDSFDEAYNVRQSCQ